MRVYTRILILCLLGLLSACATTANLKELRQVTPSGTPYAIALTQRYLEFSEAEAKNHDWTDSSYFAEKGLMSGYGQQVTPEEISSWNIAEELKPELMAARAKLLELVDEEAKLNSPKLSAQAFYAFDCWVEELDEGWDSAAISSCQTSFYTALEGLEFAKLEAADVQPISNTAYLVYFGHNLTHFTQASNQVVQQVIEQVMATKPNEIIIHGHTDTAGSEIYNMKLSEKRALSVLEALIEGGIPKAILKYFAFGETDPAMPTNDGVPEKQNRRVEVFIG